MSRRQRYLPLVILLIGCALLWNAHAQEAVSPALPLSSVLQAVDGHQIVDQRIGDAERQLAGMTEYVARAYVRDSTVAFTTLVSYYDRQTQGRTIHSPRNCLPGAGWEIVNGGAREVVADGQRHQINRYVLKNGTAMAVAYYWYQGRGRVTANEYRVKWNLLRDAAVHGRTEEALVRLVIPVASQSASAVEQSAAITAADEKARSLLSRMISDVGRALPPLT